MLNRINSKNIHTKLAVSEIIGALLMLGIATCSFSVIYFTVISSPAPSNGPIVEISGMIDENQVIITHQGGEPLDLDTNLVLNIGGSLNKFKVADLLDSKSKEDGVWSLGERLTFPIDYNFDYSLYPTVNINVIDNKNNTIVMMGTTKLKPTCDLGVELKVDKINPRIYENVVFTLKVTNYWNITASGALIEFSLPEALTFVNSTTDHGSYNNNNIWYLGNLEARTNATLKVTAKLKKYGYNVTTQFVILMDGSGSIATDSWILACDGLLSAFNDELVFPRDGSVELTIIQFGKNKKCAFAEVGPVIVDKNNIEDIIKDITELKNNFSRGWTPLANGFYLSNILLKNSQSFGGFNSDYRQVFMLVTDGNANVRTDPCKECGYNFIDEWRGKKDAAKARDYLINNLNLTEDRDEIDVIAVNPGSGSIDQNFLTDKIVWPQPCYEDIPPSGSGWYRYVESWQEFVDSIDEFFVSIFNHLLIKVNIRSTAFFDPKLANDEASVILKPLS